MPDRFLPLAAVRARLGVGVVAALDLARSGELPAVQVGGRGVWRVEATVLEAWVVQRYAGPLVAEVAYLSDGDERA